MSEHKSRNIFLYEQVNQQSIFKLTKELLEIIEEDDKESNKLKKYERHPIKLYISSYGGSLDSMWGIIDLMLTSKTPIYTYCTGFAMSAGFLIFLAGSKRYSYKHSQLHFHELSIDIGGYLKHLQDQIEYETLLQEKVDEFVCGRTKIKKIDIEKIREAQKDWYFRLEELIPLGIVNEIIE